MPNSSIVFKRSSMDVIRRCVLICTTLLPSTSFSQEIDDHPEDQIEGRVIYSRDVPYGSAIGPRTPSATDSVVTGPTNLLLRAIATGLEPLGDKDNASVVANAMVQTRVLGNNSLIGLEMLNGQNGISTSLSQNGTSQASIVGNSVGQATGAMRDAMSSLRNALGGGK